MHVRNPRSLTVIILAHLAFFFVSIRLETLTGEPIEPRLSTPMASDDSCHSGDCWMRDTDGEQRGTGKIRQRARDRRAAEQMTGAWQASNRVTNATEVRRMARTWARLLRERLDDYGAKR